MDKILKELVTWNKNVDDLIMEAKNIITIDNFMNEDLIVENKKKLFEKVIMHEKTFSDIFYMGSQSFFNIINNKMKVTLDLRLSEYAKKERYFYNKIFLGNFEDINLCDFLSHVTISIGTAHHKVYYYEDDIRFYCKDITDENKVKSLHIQDYQKEILLFFNDRLN